LDSFVFILEGKGIWVGVIVQKDRLERVILGKNEQEVISRLRSLKDPLFSDIKKEHREIGNLATSIKKDLAMYLSGKRIDFLNYPLQLGLSQKAKKVLFAVRKIPYGQVRSYRWVARSIKSKGYRAVGRILSINPFPIIIPCHRVIRSDGKIGGFSAGVEIKRRLLRLEGVAV